MDYKEWARVAGDGTIAGAHDHYLAWCVSHGWNPDDREVFVEYESMIGDAAADLRELRENRVAGAIADLRGRGGVG